MANEAIEIAAAKAIAEVLSPDRVQLGSPHRVVRSYVPVYSLSDGELDETTLTITPSADAMEPLTRASASHAIQIEIGVQRRLPQNTPPAVDQMIEVCRAIKRLLLPNHDPASSQAIIVDSSGERFYPLRITHDPTFFPDHLREYGVFTAVLQVELQGFR